jgi:predicted dehydrogenase
MRLGLVGAGRWGKRYIATISAMEDITLAHLASANPDSAKLIPPRCRLSSDWRLATGDRTLDGLILATPPATHLGMALDAIANGIPVLVEKPMTLSVPDAQSLVDHAQRSNVLVMVDHTLLFSSAFRELKARGGSLGRLLGTQSAGGNRGPFRLDTPVLWDWGPHDIAMCLELFGAMPDAVAARRVATAQYPDGAGEAIEIALDFGGCRRSEIRVSNITERKQRWFKAIYGGGTLVYDDLALEKLVFRRGGSSLGEAVVLDASLTLTNAVGEFCRRIASGERSSASLELGLRVVRILADCQAKLDSADALRSASRARR